MAGDTSRHRTICELSQPSSDGAAYGAGVSAPRHFVVDGIAPSENLHDREGRADTPRGNSGATVVFTPTRPAPARILDGPCTGSHGFAMDRIAATFGGCPCHPLPRGQADLAIDGFPGAQPRGGAKSSR